MTDEGEAWAKVKAHIGTDEFHLEEFPEGWLVVRHWSETMMGSGSFVVERATGALLHFPSSVPPMRVTQEFDEVRSEGYAV